MHLYTTVRSVRAEEPAALTECVCHAKANFFIQNLVEALHRLRTALGPGAPLFESGSWSRREHAGLDPLGGCSHDTDCYLTLDT